MGNSRIIINTIEDTLVSSSTALPLEIGVVLKSPRGEVGKPIKVTTEAELIEKFGTPTTAFPVLDAVRMFLRLYGGITISRVKNSVDEVLSSVNLDNDDPSAPIEIVKLSGVSRSDYENGFQLDLTASGSDLVFALSDADDVVLETFTVPAEYSEFISQVNQLSSYVVASALPGATGNVGVQSVVFSGGDAGFQFVKQDVLDAIDVFDSATIGRMDVIAAPGLVDNTIVNDFEEVVAALVDVANSRFETIALADFVENKSVTDVIALVNALPETPTNYKFSSKIAYYHPGVKMRLTSAIPVVVPASMAALFVHAEASMVSKWASPAGFTSSMAIPNVSDFYFLLKQSEVDLLYNIANADRPAINPIVYDNSVGWVIDGQRTAADSADLRRSLSLEKLIDEIQYQTNLNSKKYQYKPNNQTTWDAWKLEMTTYMNNILALGGITSFQVFMGLNTMTQTDIQNGLLKGVIKLVPTFTIEEIQITINVKLEA